MTSRTVPAAAVWGVGVVNGRPWRVSPEDINDETESAVEHLRLLGVGAGGLVLIVSRLSETIHVAPLELACGRLSARWSSADATAGDAFRSASLVHQLRPDAVIGVNGAFVAAVGDAAAALAGVPAVAVTDAVARDAIPSARWWLRLGPANAFECAARVGAHYDGARWRVEERDGELVISNVVHRLTTAARMTTGLIGTVVDDTCPCGSKWPRVALA